MEGVAGAAGELEAAEHSITDIVVWIVRVSLPILLFFIWYRSQPDKGPTGNVYGRNLIMDVRQAPEVQEPPEALQTLRLVSEVQVQKILGIPGPRGSVGQGGGGRRESGKGKGKGDKGGGRGRGSARGGEATPVVAGSIAAPVEVDPFALGDEERLHAESLFNFVAFSYKDRPQRIFLPDDDQPPPPPPKRPSAIPGEANVAETTKANIEAQLILKGLTNPKLGIKSSVVAKTLSEQLVRQAVPPAEATYSLIVESCVNAGDLRAASDFLNKMETVGHCADSQLLDKVMDLYSETRGTPAAGGAPPAASSSGAGGYGRGGGGLCRGGGSRNAPWMEDEEPFSFGTDFGAASGAGQRAQQHLGAPRSSGFSSARPPAGRPTGADALFEDRHFDRAPPKEGVQRSPWSDDEDGFGAD